MLNSIITTPTTRFASRRPMNSSNLELDNKPIDVLSQPISNVPSWKPTLGEIDANLRSIKDFFLPLGGDDFNTRVSHGRTALHTAALNGHEVVVEYLILHGADIYAKDGEGITPLDEANRCGNHNLATLMLEKQVPKKFNLATPIKEEDALKKGRVIKLMFALINVGIELSQVILSQETKRGYRRIGIGLAFVCLMVSVFEMVYEAKRDRVDWRKISRGFGSLMLWFGLVSSSVQLCVSMVSLSLKKPALKLDYMGLLLAFMYLMARVGSRERRMRGVIRCSNQAPLAAHFDVEPDRVVAPKLRHSTRTSVRPSHLNEYVAFVEVDCERLLLANNDEPFNFEEAKIEKVWVDACKDELRSIDKNKTWKSVDLDVVLEFKKEMSRKFTSTMEYWTLCEQVKVKHISGEKQRANILTEELGRVKFKEMRDSLEFKMCRKITSSLRGRMLD